MALTLGKITVGGQLFLRMDDGTEVDLGRVERELDLRLDMAGSVEFPLPPLGVALAPEPEEPVSKYDVGVGLQVGVLAHVRAPGSPHDGKGVRVVEWNMIARAWWVDYGDERYLFLQSQLQRLE